VCFSYPGDEALDSVTVENLVRQVSICCSWKALHHVVTYMLFNGGTVSTNIPNF
jgi:hypothetical protein